MSFPILSIYFLRKPHETFFHIDFLINDTDLLDSFADKKGNLELWYLGNI